MEGQKNKRVIITHLDLDGITCAALLAEQLGIEPEELKVVFTAPNLLYDVCIPVVTDEVYITDIAVNRDDPGMTKTFYDYLGDRLKQWYDHHLGWEGSDMTIQYGGKVIAKNSPACAAMLGHSADQRVIDAVVADTREGEFLKNGRLIDRATKSNVKDRTIKEWAVKLLMGAEEYREPLLNAEIGYQVIENETNRLAEGYELMYKKPHGEALLRKYKIAYVDITSDRKPCDLTQLLLKGQGIADFAIVKRHPPNSEVEIITIATKTDINLVKILGLRSGSPYRVTISGDLLNDVTKKLEMA